MLKAFFNQLRYLADNNNDLFHEHIQKRIGERADAAFVKELKETILLMPDIVARISVLWARLSERSSVRAVGSYFITYMYSPQDFIPENEANGLFGYLDDAYLACLVYNLLTDEILQSGAPLSKEDEALRKQLIGRKDKINSVIPYEATKIQQMIGEVLVGEDATFTSLFVDAQVSKEVGGNGVEVKK